MNNTPPRKIQQVKLIPVILKLKDCYGVWQDYVAHFPKSQRYTLGSKIDEIFLASIEYCFVASYSSASEKVAYIDKGISRVDLIKLFIQLSWERKYLDSNKYEILSARLSEIGKMLGGWKLHTKNKTPAKN